MSRGGRAYVKLRKERRNLLKRCGVVWRKRVGGCGESFGVVLGVWLVRGLVKYQRFDRLLISPPLDVDNGNR